MEVRDERQDARTFEWAAAEDERARLSDRNRAAGEHPSNASSSLGVNP